MGPSFRPDDAGRARRQPGPCLLGTAASGHPEPAQPPHPAAFPASGSALGNLALTMISVWLGAECRAKSPRFDMLAGEAGPGFGRAPHATGVKRLLRSFAAPGAGPWNRCRLQPA